MNVFILPKINAILIFFCCFSENFESRRNCSDREKKVVVQAIQGAYKEQ